MCKQQDTGAVKAIFSTQQRTLLQKPFCVSSCKTVKNTVKLGAFCRQNYRHHIQGRQNLCGGQILSYKLCIAY